VGDWGSGLGMLYVYIDDLHSPVISTPIDLASTLDLDCGRAYVGFTAATGDEHWQAHDILNWQFSSLFIDKDYTPPLVINGDGAHECVDETACVHPADYDHFIRKSNIWGAGYDTTTGWQTGMEGYCSAC
jgi:Legume lectin domain